MNKKIGIFFGSDTGNTEKVSKIIHDIIGKNISDIYNISECNKSDIEKYNFLILGTPTWYYGELQYDWNEFIPILKKINFSKKKISLFGCGDQEDYSEYFCDAMYYLWDIIIKNNGEIIGYWPKDGYKFKSSKSLLKNNNFVGLVIDEDRQKNKTIYRIKKWLSMLYIL